MAPIPLALRFTHPFLFSSSSSLSREHSLKKSPPKNSRGEDRIQEWKWDKKFEGGARQTRELEKEIFYCLRHETSFEDLRHLYPTLLVFYHSHPLISCSPPIRGTKLRPLRACWSWRFIRLRGWLYWK